MLRDAGINEFAIVGVATEIGIEPTVRHGVDLGYIPIVIRDACGAGHLDAGDRSIATLQYLGDALFTTADEFATVLHRVSVARAGTKREAHVALDVDARGRAAVTVTSEQKRS